MAIFLIMINGAIASDVLPQKKPPLFINFCENAQTPADQQDCIKKRFENAEDILNGQFSELKLFLRGSAHAEDLGNVQNSWITYRNRECGFESSFFEEEIAKRTLELTCLSRLTEDRALLLYNLIPRTRDQIQMKISEGQENNNG